ncbi:LysR family transcriptional regulator [Nocardioides guangzhouensis]|uniref:LysR family transcriptional regulator n=1 Tax=Nocardioides guangzhouensis TaxID=2497878 RepID=A0A4Q4ZA02_9ACTN|nr:LysR family transcriptional regulator [Nocardioides guangzhouensis]RYP84026.1 LysR family transcriptional regulator [Nocardioides guangzhouensis]
MSLGGTDLNLLLSLKVLLEEGNVTRAGRRLALSQPAMSAALARLRRKFDDELLIRSGREYELTPFAQELLPEVQHAVRLMSQALRVEEDFDPATSERTFRLTMSDYAIAVLHDPLVAVVSASAPGVRLRIDHLGPDVRSSDRVLLEYDALVGPLGFGFPGESRPLWRDRMVCLVDAGHPCLERGGLTLDDLGEFPHAVASFGPGILTPVDRIFGELAIDRRIEVTVPGFLPLPFVVEGTQLVAVLPARLARMHARPGSPVAQVEPPFDEVVLAEGYWYGRDRLADPAHQWLFARLDEVRELLAPATA